jgi:hypothetical protein
MLGLLFLFFSAELNIKAAVEAVELTWLVGTKTDVNLMSPSWVCTGHASSSSLSKHNLF